MNKGIHRFKKTKHSEKMEPVMAHLKELRRTVIGSLIAITAGAAVCYGFFREFLMELFTMPLEYLDIAIIYTNVSESFTTEMKVGILAGIITASPIVFLLIWHFIGPGLFPKEKKRILIYVPIAVILFGAGVCFCYFIVFPFVLQFFLSAASVDMEAMLTISNYVDFLCKMMIPFGLAFETPLVVYFLASFHIVSINALKKVRKYVLLACFIVGAIITPPDVVSQLFVSAPIYLMYEIGIILGRITEKYRTRNCTATTI